VVRPGGREKGKGTQVVLGGRQVEFDFEIKIGTMTDWWGWNGWGW